MTTLHSAAGLKKTSRAAARSHPAAGSPGQSVRGDEVADDERTATTRRDRAGGKVRISITLDLEHLRHLDELAASHVELNRSLVVRRLVSEHARMMRAGQQAARVIGGSGEAAEVDPRGAGF